MAIYEIKPDSLAKIEETSFSKAGRKERADLQRLLRTQIEIISPDNLIMLRNSENGKSPNEGSIFWVWEKMQILLLSS